MSPKMRVYKLKDFIKLVERNGYLFNRQTGDHRIYVNSEGKHISVPFSVNPCITRRLIKEHNLQ